MSTPPTEPEILVMVAEAIVEQKEIDIDVIKMDSTFESLGLDSLDAMEIMFELEEKLDVDIPDRAARVMRNVGDVVEGLGKLARGEEIELPEEPEPAADAAGGETATPAGDGVSEAPRQEKEEKAG